MINAKSMLSFLAPLWLVALVVPQASSRPASPASVADAQANLPADAPAGLVHVDRAGLRLHAFELASDAYEGRYTGSRGQIKAASYIARYFASLGLLPLGDQREGGERTFLQHYQVERSFLDAEQCGISIGGETYRSGFGMLPGSVHAGAKLEGEFFFAGLGSPKQLPTGDLNSVIPVIFLRSRPLKIANPQIKLGMSFGLLARAQQIGGRLVAAGAKAAIFCMTTDENGIADVINMMGITPEKHRLKFGKDAGMSMGAEIPLVFASASLSSLILKQLAVTIDAAGKPTQGELAAPVLGSLNVEVAIDAEFLVPNVVAYLEGSDPELNSEALIYSAHMDHMGVRMDGDVFNGADDNASGSASLLEIAEAYAKGERPERSVIFLSVSGEELGLWGSKYYADHPTWPLAKLVANINIDMIGRVTSLSDEHEVSVTPSYRHKMYSSIGRRSAELAAKLGMGLTIGDVYYARSDHYNFARKGIPVVFFCDGEHEDYHQVTDHADKLDFAKMERITKLAYWTGFEVANAPQRPVVLGPHRGWLGEKRSKK